MSSRLRIALALSLFALLLAFAYSPLLQAGLTAADYASLITGESDPASTWNEGGAASFIEKPLAHGSLILSRRLWGLPSAGSVAGGPALFLRLENLVLLVLAGIGLGVYTRRLLLPWSGSEQARAAAYSSAVFFALYPLATPAVAAMSARGDLIGMACAAWSAAFFLRGRQDRKVAFTVVSLVLCVLAGFASDLVLGLPLLLFASEFLSAHRYRPLRTRLRTAFSTLLIFGGGVAIDTILDAWRVGSAAIPPGLRALGAIASADDASRQLLIAIEKLGILVLPANPEVLGIAGWALAGTLFLLAMQPALVAARSAPRLWGWLLFAWLVALAVSEVFHAHVRVTPRELSLARTLLPSAAVMAIGLALGATALSGPKRPYVAWIVAFGYASLAHANALPWRSAAEDASILRGELAATLETFGRDASVFVLEPPRPTGGVDPVGMALPWLVHAELDGGAPDRGTALPRVRGVSRAAFLVLIDEPEFTALRAGDGTETPFVVLNHPGEGAEEARGAREPWVVPAPSPSASPSPWRAMLRSPDMDIDSLEYGALVVTASPGADLAALGTVSWSTRANVRGSHTGAWVDTGGELTGVFDLSSSLAWRESGRIRNMLFEQGRGSIGRAEPRIELPSLGALVPEERDGDWVFPAPSAPLTEATGGRGRFVLGLLELGTLAHRELSGAQRGDELVVEGAAKAVAEALGHGRGPLVWVLDYRIDGHVIARTRGRQEELQRGESR